jgi:hypothetical protein
MEDTLHDAAWAERTDVQIMSRHHARLGEIAERDNCYLYAVLDAAVASFLEADDDFHGPVK